MSTRSGIEWTETTWNPVTGCSKISHGCTHCYAERMAARLQAMGVSKYRQGFDVAVHEGTLDEPLRWRQPRLVFVNSMSDLFHPSVPTSFIEAVFAVMNRANQHTFQVLTKRPDRVKLLDDRVCWTPNIWLGVSIESERWLGRRELLVGTGARTRFLSLEPLLGSLHGLDLTGIDWGDRRRRVRPGRQADAGAVGQGDPGYLRPEQRAVLLQTVGRGIQEEDGSHA